MAWRSCGRTHRWSPVVQTPIDTRLLPCMKTIRATRKTPNWSWRKAPISAQSLSRSGSSRLLRGESCRGRCLLDDSKTLNTNRQEGWGMPAFSAGHTSVPLQLSCAMPAPRAFFQLPHQPRAHHFSSSATLRVVIGVAPPSGTRRASWATFYEIVPSALPGGGKANDRQAQTWKSTGVTYLFIYF